MKVGIVGAGPAGTRLAQLLGEDAVLFDPTHPREKPCGGGLTPKSYSSLDIPKRLVEDVMDTMFIHYLDKTVSFSIPQVISVNRQDFDLWMLKEAKRAGATHISERVTDLVYGRNGWVVITDDGEYTFDFIVGADGAQSIVRKKLVGPHKYIAVAMETKFSPALEGGMHFWFFDNFFGYAWSFSKSGYSNVGIGQFVSGGRNDMLGLLKSIFPSIREDELRGWILPIDYGKVGYNKFALIGDAAGHINPISGEGISYAMMGAEELARAIKEGHPENYEKYWRNRFGRELVWDMRMSKVVYHSIPKSIRFPKFLSRAMPSIIMGRPVTPLSVLSWLL